MFDTVLIANRGAIACRILRTLRRMGLRSVAVYSEADAGSPHVSLADEAVCIGPAPAAQSYLDAERILAAARQTGAGAIHPGYGFLSENPAFAEACEAAGLAFIGPTPQQMRAFGLKHTARELARAHGVPLLPGSALLAGLDEARAEASHIGYPVMLKSTAGGGGIGMRLVRGEAELAAAWEAVERLARANFKDAGLYLEKFVERARHLEVQLFGDGQGRVVALGERDCSAQRRNQKVIEETPAPHLPAATRRALIDAAVRLGEAVQYRSAGTVEFVYDDATGDFHFLEVNTRLQVEHGVTEQVTGVDLVEWMVRCARGDALSLDVPEPQGASIQVRLYAEDPSRQFQPSAGLLTEVVFPDDVRLEGWVGPGSEVPPHYDPMIAKLIVTGTDRTDAVARLQQALAHTRLAGIETNLRWLRTLAAHPTFVDGRVITATLGGIAWQPRAVEVLEGGVQTSVQDHPGRLGHWDVGVPPSGPMDDLSHRLANRLVGNAPQAAALECTLQGPTLRFHAAATVALVGAPMDATLKRPDAATAEPLPMGTAVEVPAGAVLAVGRVRDAGARAVLAVRGGLDVPHYLGSRSTFTLGQFGGHGGRTLRTGDLVHLADDVDPAATAPAAVAALQPPCTHAWQVGVLYGPHGAPDFFTDDDIRTFFATDWKVHHNSSRTGVRLIGPKPAWARHDGGEAGLHPSNIHDNAYAIGAIDFTGDMPVILGPDGPSLGGFVCPAVVAAAERWKLGQLRPGDTVRFVRIGLDDALALQRALDAAVSHGSLPLAGGASPLDPLPLAGRASPLDPLPLAGGGLGWGSSAGPAGTSPSAACHPHPNPAPARGREESPVPPARSWEPSPVLVTRAAADDRPALAVRQAGDRYLLVEVGPLQLDLALRLRVHALAEALRRQIAQRGHAEAIVDMTPGIRSLQVHFDPLALPQAALLQAILAADEAIGGDAQLDDLEVPSRTVVLPLAWDDSQTQLAIRKYMQSVRPDAPWCPSNLEFIRRINGLGSIDDVHRIVFGAEYLVLGLGDVYLGAPVATPVDPRHRLVTTKYNPARTWTPENAVGIGGAYLCVYGMEGPGGYQFVGRTVQMWNRWRDARTGAAAFEPGKPWLLRFFDRIRFEPVTENELMRLRRDFPEGRVALRIEPGSFRLRDYRAFLQAEATSIAAFKATQQAAFEAERERWRAAGLAETVAEDAAAAPSGLGADDLPEGSRAVASPVPGSVWKVLVAEGAQVAAGDTLVVVESMKMEFAVTAPAAGTVLRVGCREGAAVAAGQDVVVLGTAAASTVAVG